MPNCLKMPPKLAEMSQYIEKVLVSCWFCIYQSAYLAACLARRRATALLTRCFWNARFMLNPMESGGAPCGMCTSMVPSLFVCMITGMPSPLSLYGLAFWVNRYGACAFETQGQDIALVLVTSSSSKNLSMRLIVFPISSDCVATWIGLASPSRIRFRCRIAQKYLQNWPKPTIFTSKTDSWVPRQATIENGF